MLIEFRVENYRSIRDEQVFTMEAGKVGRVDKSCLREVAGSPKKLLPVAAIYGANASGKSNLLAALGFMNDAVVSSLLAWSPGHGIAHDPFAWGPRRSEPTTFEVEMVVDGVRYRYGFRHDSAIFLEEWLYAWPHGKKQTWFERDRDKLSFGEHFKGENRTVAAVTRPNALFLSAASQLSHPQIAPIYKWFLSVQTINYFDLGGAMASTSSQGRFLNTWNASYDNIDYLITRFLEHPSYIGYKLGLNKSATDLGDLVDRFKLLIKQADIGIVDVRVVEGPTTLAAPRRIEFQHQNQATDAWLPLEDESRGTKTLLQLALPVLIAIDRGGLLIVDELESSMHPNLVEHLVRQFNDPATNPNNAQLIFSTHDTNLLGTLSGVPALRRDQVWLVEKDETGASVVYPLTDFKPRQGENVERGYIQGRYGAIPYLGNLRIGAK